MNPLENMERMMAYAADHRNQLLKEAATARLLQEAQPQDRPSAAGRVLEGVGDLLIATGNWLKGHRASSVPPVR